MADKGACAGRLIIMVKEPRLGAVKTRLAAEIGAAAATRFYRGATDHLIRRLASDRRWRTLLAVAPDAAIAARRWPARVPRLRQGGGDIGVRMERLLLAQRPHPAVLIGSDIPGIAPRHIAEAFALLCRHDVVFGPATDGGFWLVGIKPLPHLPGMFRDVRWSSPDALADTLANLAGRRIGFAARLPDVDDAEGYWASGANALRVTPARGGAYSSS
jgi:uncharacterized protein